MVDAKLNREQAVREAKCNLILDAAREVFAQVGFHNARLEDIAASAGFSKASLYNYFDSKEVIFLNLAVREYESMVQRLNVVVNPADPLEQKLTNVVGCIFEVLGKHFPLLMEISEFRRLGYPGFSETMKSHHELFEMFKRFTMGIQNQLARLFAVARQRGEIAGSFSDKTLARYFVAMVQGVLFEWKVAGSMGDVQSETTTMLRFFMNGVRGNAGILRNGVE